MTDEVSNMLKIPRDCLNHGLYWGFVYLWITYMLIAQVVFLGVFLSIRLSEEKNKENLNATN